MDELVREIRNTHRQVTRDDIARLLASIAPAGDKRDEKIAAVRSFYDALGQSGVNRISEQSFHVAGTLSTYEAW